MREIYCIKCKKYNEFKKPKISYICYRTLLFPSIICNKCRSDDEQIFMEAKSTEILKILGLIDTIEDYQKIYNDV